MKQEHRPILINAVINYLAEENKKKNKALVLQNLYSEQQPFDTVSVFLDLAFMPDAELEKIASLVLNTRPVFLEMAKLPT